jgi:hypothetical protein
MVETIPNIAIQGIEPRRHGMRNLWLTARWGMAATAMLAAAVYTAGTDAGIARITTAFATARGEAPVPSAQEEQAALLADTRELAETVQTLAADRDRLAARLETLERNLEEVTGSIARQPERPAEPLAITPAPGPAPQAAPMLPPNPVAPGFVLLEPALGFNRAPVTAESSEETWSAVPMPRAAPRPQAMVTGSIPQHQQDSDAGKETARPDKPAYGIDLGGATTLDGIRAIWMAQRGKHSALSALTPSVANRPGQRGGAQLRLVAGPLPSAAAAAQICAMLNASRTLCQPSVYDGQPLALR